MEGVEQRLENMLHKVLLPVQEERVVMMQTRGELPQDKCMRSQKLRSIGCETERG